jgi:hypothetical protein
VALAVLSPPLEPADSQGLAKLHARIDDCRIAMESEMGTVRTRAQTYLNWYSPEYNDFLGTHDAWVDPIMVDDVGLTRANFPVCRPVVDIWTALESAKPPTLWAQPERIAPPVPSFDQSEVLRRRLVGEARKQLNAVKATHRARIIREQMRRDGFAYKAFLATRKKNLYGFAWQKVWPNRAEKRTASHTLTNPTTVYPIWSTREPGELEMVLVAYQMNVNKANAMYGLGIDTKGGRIARGVESGVYREVADRWFDTTRTMVWVEEFWWREQTFDRDGNVVDSAVACVKRIMDKIVEHAVYPDWRKLPWVYWENSDERDAFGWSDIANAIDINDEINRRLSQQGDIIGMYSAPRYQLVNSFNGRDVEMPGPFELISLNDQERIEQILTRIDVFPAQFHLQFLFNEVLPRATGLPPIVWGLIANAQTSGRALSASWKATEARLAPKLLRNERSYNDYLDLSLQYNEVYDWRGSKRLFADDDEGRFRDFRWEFPPMEPRDFMEVTQNEITKRDAGATTSLKMIRAMGDEAAEETWEEVQAEMLNIFAHPDKVQSFLLAQRAELDNIAYAKELGQQLDPGGGMVGGAGGGAAVNPVTIAGAVGMARAGQADAASSPPPAVGPAPSTQPGAAGNAAGPGSAGGPPGEQLSSGTLVRNGEVSNQYLQTRRM